jgi:hypothetical protein
VIPSGYAQANFVLTGTGLPTGAECTLGFDIGGFSGDADDCAETLFGHWADDIMPRVTSFVVLTSVSVKFGPVATGPTGEFAGTEAGGAGGQATSPNVAALIHKNTAFGGRAGRGRMYIPGLQESDLNEAGNLDSGAVTAWQASLLAFLVSVTGDNLDPVVLHGVGSPLSTPSPITSLTIDSKVATQRRRLRR